VLPSSYFITYQEKFRTNRFRKVKYYHSQ